MRERAAIYCRLSEEDKNKQNANDESCSIQNQRAMLIDYADRMGWEIYGIYSDDDYTGSDRSRPAFKRLLADAEAKKFDIILCKTQSRFTRELELVERYIHGCFPIWGIRFVSIVDNADTANRGNKKSRQINGLVNEWYLEDMSESIKAALVTRRKNGFHIGSFALYGYRKDPDRRGHLIIDEEAAAVVREVFSLFSQGYGKTAIARTLNDRGIPNPSEYKRRQGLRYQPASSKSSTLWKYFAISNMLRNEIYIGNLVQGKYESISYKTGKSRPRPKENWYVVEGTHEPIIDRVLWDRVQSMIGERAKPFASGTVGLFAGKARCAYCGYVMRSSKSGGKRFLQCPNRRVSGEACRGSFISVDKLERAVIAERDRLSRQYLDMDELERKVKFCTGLPERRKALQGELASCQGKIGELARGMRELYLDKVKGLLCESDFIELAKGFTEEKQRLKTRVEECERQILELGIKAKAGENRREVLRQYVNEPHLTRQAVQLLIDKIRIFRRIEGTRNVPIEIHWNF